MESAWTDLKVGINVYSKLLAFSTTTEALGHEVYGLGFEYDADLHPNEVVAVSENGRVAMLAMNAPARPDAADGGN